MISNDCRCPGCGTCDAASKNASLRKSLREAKQKYAERSRVNESYVKHLHAAERERDEARAEVERLRAEVDSAKAALIDAALIHAELIQERDKLHGLRVRWMQLRKGTWRRP